jgi:hypothetical protein
MDDDPRPNPEPIVPHPKKSKVPLIKALFIYQSWYWKESRRTI